MLYQIRLENGKPDSTSKGVVVDQNGVTTRLDWNDLKHEVLGNWTSPETGVQYPSGWKLSIPSENLNFQINPLIKKQELRTSVNYWEGAVEVISLLDQSEKAGRGYVELTGYQRVN